MNDAEIMARRRGTLGEASVSKMTKRGFSLSYVPAAMDDKPEGRIKVVLAGEDLGY